MIAELMNHIWSFCIIISKAIKTWFQPVNVEILFIKNSIKNLDHFNLNHIKNIQYEYIKNIYVNQLTSERHNLESNCYNYYINYYIINRFNAR